MTLTRRPDAAADALARLSRAEVLAVWQGVANGIVRAAHGLQQGAGAVLELETGTLDEVQRFVESLPYVAEDLLDVQYCPLKPFVAFESLFAPAQA
ncbi:hypothetical protein [Variovorax sp. CF079]|uniref:hypothetical protein n=1 Tax=Variovorax sp. CF079 TaxID=1882774 RepID=UPI001BAF875F|nr:hypothetical protein [Variovorax sp. CF079]